MNPLSSAAWTIAQQLRKQEEYNSELLNRRCSNQTLSLNEGIQAGLSAVNSLFAQPGCHGKLDGLGDAIQLVSAWIGGCESLDNHFRKGFDIGIEDALKILRQYHDVESLPLPSSGASQEEVIEQVNRAANALILKFQEDSDLPGFLEGVAILHSSYGHKLREHCN